MSTSGTRSKKKKKSSNQNQITTNQSNNDGQHKDEGATDGVRG